MLLSICWPPFYLLDHPGSSYNSSKWWLLGQTGFETRLLLCHSFPSQSSWSYGRAPPPRGLAQQLLERRTVSGTHILTMQPGLGTMIHILLPPYWVAFMAGFIAPIYLFRKCRFENINLKTRKQLRRKIECALFWNEFNKLYFRTFLLFQIYFSECPSTSYPKKKEVNRSKDHTS